MTISEVKRQTRIKEWAQRIGERQESGMSIDAWCTANDCRKGRYYYWLKTVRMAAIENAKPATPCTALVRVDPEELPFSTLALPMETGSEKNSIVIRYEKATLELPTETPVTIIVELLKALGAPCQTSVECVTITSLVAIRICASKSTDWLPWCKCSSRERAG